MKTEQEIKKQIWQYYSDNRGLMHGLQMNEFVIAFTFLRRIDCLIGKYAKECETFYLKNREILSDQRLDKALKELSGGFPFYNYSGYNFDSLLNAHNSVEVVVNSYLQGFSDTVKNILRGLNFMENLSVIQSQSRYLVTFFFSFSKFDLSASSVDNEEFKEIIFYLITIISKNEPLFYTSEVLSNIISKCLFSDDIRQGKDGNINIYDPVCGTGILLATACEEARPFVIHQENIGLYGQEIFEFSSAVAMALVLLSGNENSKVFHGDTLIDDKFRNEQFQYIVADLPFNLQWDHYRERIYKECDDVNGRFCIGLPNTTDSQFLFIEHIISKMDSNGCRAAFTTTGSVLWGGPATSGESRIRKWLFENDLVETIIALPKGIQSRTNIPVYLWIISNIKKDNQKGKVRLIDASLKGRRKNNIDIDEDFALSVINEYDSNIVSDMSQIVNNEQFGYYEVGLLENGKKFETVTISLDTDIHMFVQKERQPYIKGEITIDYTSVEKGYSVNFEKFFENKHEDVADLVDATKDLLPVIDSISSLKNEIVKIIGGTAANSWKEYPLRAVAEIVFKHNKPTTQSSDGLPLLSVSYLTKPSEDSPRFEVTPITVCSTVKDIIVILKGEKSGEVYRGVEGILTPAVALVKCNNEQLLIPQYLYYLLKGHENILKSMIKDVSPNIPASNLILDLRCLIPPVGEQQRLVSYLDNIIGKIDNINCLLGSSENVFSVYRQTLIENVVRGKVII